MQSLKLQDDHWVIYQQNGLPAHWQLAGNLSPDHAKLLHRIPQEQTDEFLTDHFLEALANLLEDNDWKADFDGSTGEIELTSDRDDLTEKNVRACMQAAIDEAVEMLLDALLTE